MTATDTQHVEGEVERAVPFAAHYFFLIFLFICDVALFVALVYDYFKPCDQTLALWCVVALILGFPVSFTLIANRTLSKDRRT